MKKCASCSKDLPDAALHCVFCGAKQAPAPAVPQNHAKTAFGYSQNEVMDALGHRAPPDAQTQPPRAQRPSQMPAGNPRSPIAAAEHDAATVLVPTTPQGPQGSFNNQQAFAATDYGSTPSPVAGAGYGAAAPYGAPSPPANAPSAAPYGGTPAAYNASGPAGAPYGNASPGYGGPVPSFGNPAPSYGNPAPAYGNPAPAPAYGNPAPAPAYGNPAPTYGNVAPGYIAPAPTGAGMGIHSQHLRTEPVPTASAPYRGAHAGMRGAWPIDPWKDGIKLVMYVWGAVALVTFAAPLHADPYAFQWDTITDAPGKAKLAPLLWAASGLLSIICAAIPMPTLPRGIVAAALGLAGALTPLLVLGATPEALDLIAFAGTLLLIPGLLVRNEYTESIVPRILVTVGVVAVLLHELVPVHSEIPLVTMFKGIIDAPGSDKLTYALDVVKVVLVVMTLLAWMPGPATGGGKLFAWALILFPIAHFLLHLVLAGHIGDVASKTPARLVEWAPEVVFTVLSGYGLATIIGAQLE